MFVICEWKDQSRRTRLYADRDTAEDNSPVFGCVFEVKVYAVLDWSNDGRVEDDGEGHNLFFLSAFEAEDYLFADCGKGSYQIIEVADSIALRMVAEDRAVIFDGMV